VWNSLPTGVRSYVTKTTFCEHLKTHLFRVSYGHVSKFHWVFSARQHIAYAIARYMPSPARLSGRLSVTRVDQSKTVEVRIMQPSPQSSPMTLVS